jgi:hypothetical protein
MTSFDLLNAVLPPEGRYCAWGNGRYISQKFFTSRTEFDENIKWLVDNNFDAYFGCAKYGEAENRKQSNAHFFKSIWMDIDCGEEKAKPDKDGKIKGYIDQSTGFKAVKAFIKKHSLPRPIVVNSGYGLHFYWPLDTVVRRNEWEALAHRLRDLALEDNLIVDTSVFEASRVLRVPGTYNFKNNQRAPVAVLSEEHDVTAYDTWKTLINAPEPAEERAYIPRRLSPLMESMMENRIKRFKTIMIKSASGEGCNQLIYCYENQDSIGYNLWRSALSVATHCVDRESAIHKMSSKHPSYHPGETEEKAQDIGGPHHCTTFENENPGGCDGCQHRGKFKSPIMLGAEVAKAEEFDDGDAAEEADGADESVGIYPKSLPEPYFRAKTGALYYNVPSDDEEGPRLVYENFLYVVKRMVDPNLGEVALVRLHLPRDGVKEFPIPLAAIVVKERLREELAKQGVAAGDAQMKALMAYLITYVKNLQVTDKAETMRTQFGWAENDSKIIIGDREITVEGTFYSPPSTITKDVCDMMVPTGTLDKWKEAFNMYSRPGLEAQAFGALTAFGSPLLKFTGMSGAIINLIHPVSGTGKTTVLYVCNSVIGHPKNLTSIFKDTFNAKIHRLGVLNNFANTLDEITNTSAMEFSDLAYSISQGRGKNKMKSQVNEQRVNLTSWQGITLCSSNASFYEKLGIAKDSPDGESMRLLEYHIKPSSIISTSEGKEMFDHQLLENYGHAGDIYATWLVNNRDEAIRTLRQIQARIDHDVQFTSRERFWSATAAANITGGLISKALGLHNYDMKAIYKWMIEMLKVMRENVAIPAPDMSNVLGEFVNAHINNVVVVNGNIDSRTSMEAAPILEPKGELHIRYEPDTKKMYVSVQSFRKYCAERQVNYRNFVEQLTGKGILTVIANKRLSKGMRIVAPAVRAIELDTTKDEFLHMDEFVKVEDGDRNRSV